MEVMRIDLWSLIEGNFKGEDGWGDIGGKQVQVLRMVGAVWRFRDILSKEKKYVYPPKDRYSVTGATAEEVSKNMEAKLNRTIQNLLNSVDNIANVTICYWDKPLIHVMRDGNRYKADVDLAICVQKNMGGFEHPPQVGKDALEDFAESTEKIADDIAKTEAQEQQEWPLRRTLVMQWVEVDPRAVKRGQIFRQFPVDETDTYVNANDLCLAVDDAKMLPKDKGYAQIEMEHVTLTRQVNPLQNFAATEECFLKVRPWVSGNE